MKSLLVPTDFSPASHNAIEYAAQLAKQFNASLLLFHAYMIAAPVSEISYAMVTIDELQQANENNIKREAADIQSKFGVEAEWLVRMGIASDEIKTLLEEKKDIDLIVMGMKGAGGLDKIIGSTTTNVIRKVNIPVLIVPHDARYEPVKDITYSTDFMAGSAASLFNPLLEIAADFHPDIHVLHVEKNGHNGTHEVAGKKDIENVLANYPHDYVSVKDESITHGIHEYLEHHHTNMLVMVAHKHNFLERVFSKDHTTAMAYETRIPLMVLQDRES